VAWFILLPFGLVGRRIRNRDEHEEEKKINNEETGICVICMDKKIDTVILECAHSAVCMVCSGTLKICPICRGNITRVVKIFQI